MPYLTAQLLACGESHGPDDPREQLDGQVAGTAAPPTRGSGRPGSGGAGVRGQDASSSQGPTCERLYNSLEAGACLSVPSPILHGVPTDFGAQVIAMGEGTSEADCHEDYALGSIVVGEQARWLRLQLDPETIKSKRTKSD